VEHVGTLELRSGVLVVRDFGYEPYDLPVIARSVKAGRYAVDIVRAFDRVAAVRVRLSDEPVAAWHPAVDSEGGHVIGVDAANVAICDAAAFAAMNARKREPLYAQVVDPDGSGRYEMRPATFVALTGENDGVVVESGWGDGAYPAYFGVDASGAPAIFMVDFLVLGEEQGSGYRN
jgi:hypothetical protein